jgi:hypothetical protein
MHCDLHRSMPLFGLGVDQHVRARTGTAVPCPYREFGAQRLLVESPLSESGICVVISIFVNCGTTMTPNDFRKLALSFPETEERAHMNHPDFRVAGKIFATLGFANTDRAMVKVTPVEQEMLVRAEPSVFTPETGAWGRQGCTRVSLKAAKITTIRRALAAAWQLAAPASLAQKFPTEAAAASGGARRSKAVRSSRKKSSDSLKLKSRGRKPR